MSAQLKLEFFAGSDIVDACAEAIRIANMLRVVVVFDFNGVTVMAKPGACPKELAENAQHMLDSSLNVRIAVAHPSESGGAFHRNRRRSMADRELLELAAKAAGYKAKWIAHWHDLFRGFEVCGRSWDPLTDDGDALRLAADLSLIVECMAGQSAARTFDNRFAGACDYPAKKNDGCDRDWTPCKHAATRRAIVRAAAEIGKGMA